MSDDPSWEPPVIRELDFSEFHPLDHWPAGQRCRSLPGGTRNHLDLAWTYRWSPRLRAATKCRIGRHHWVQAWQRTESGSETFTACSDCGKRRDASPPAE
jgi:hypothetical protein